MTPAGGYKAEEGLDADAFQLPLLFWFTLLSQKHQNMAYALFIASIAALSIFMLSISSTDAVAMQ